MSETRSPWARTCGVIVLSYVAGAGCQTASVTHGTSAVAPLQSLIPKPQTVVAGDGSFKIASTIAVYVTLAEADVTSVARLLAERLRAATGHAAEVRAGTPAPGSFHLTTEAADPTLGDEGYTLTVAPEGVRLSGSTAAGLFRGVQTIRQLLPPSIESATAQPGPWTMPSVTITDRPRFPWRGAMLDVARRFFTVADVKRFIDIVAYYKMNRVHLHLSDDQGWRIAIDAWPKLATVGGMTQVGRIGHALYYTKADYAEIVAYAAARHITIVPEIDMPGHANAALTAYPELNCDGVARAPYTGIEVGFSSLCLKSPLTTTFIQDVVAEIAAMTPGPYIHFGGDEAKSTDPVEYARFLEEVQKIIAARGKRAVGWEEVAAVPLLPSSLIQQWDRGVAQKAVAQGVKLILSPAKKAYLDMKYDRSTALGQDWSGLIEVKDAYEWDPATYLEGVTESHIEGVEAPLWSETLKTIEDVEFMTLPRLAGIAEIGWSQGEGRSWDEYRVRLGIHGQRLQAMGVNFYRSPQVPWR